MCLRPFPCPWPSCCPTSASTQLWVCFLLSKHRRFPNTFPAGPHLLSGTAFGSQRRSSSREMRFLPRLGISAALGIATFLSWRLLLRSPATGQGGNVTPGHHSSPARLAAFLWLFFLRFLVGKHLQHRKHHLHSPGGNKNSGESWGGAVFYVLSGIIGPRCGGETRCQSAGGDSQNLCWEG